MVITSKKFIINLANIFYLGFSMKRVLLRTGMMLAVIFTATSIPDFEPVMGIIGGSTVALTSLVFPPLFYLYLSSNEQKTNELESLENISLNLSDAKNTGIKRY